MTVKYLYDANGNPLTEATYVHEGRDCCARVFGHHTAAAVEELLRDMRKNDRRLTARR